MTICLLGSSFRSTRKTPWIFLNLAHLWGYNAEGKSPLEDDILILTLFPGQCLIPVPLEERAEYKSSGGLILVMMQENDG